MGFFDKIRLGSALRSLGNIFKYVQNKTVDKIKNIHPLMRLYYDSKLGSKFESEFEKTFSAASCGAFQKVFPNFNWTQKLANKIGSWVSYTSVKALETSKVIYQVTNGYVPPEKGYHEIAKRSTAGLFALGKLACRAGNVIGGATHKLSSLFIDPDLSDMVKTAFNVTVGETLRRYRNKIFSEKNKERVTGFIEKGLETVSTSIKGLVDKTEKETHIKPEAAQKDKSFLSEVAKKLGETYSSLKENVTNTVKTIGNTVKNMGKKIWNLFNRK